MRTALFGMAKSWMELAFHKGDLAKLMQKREGRGDC
jgi:hypothetical protein